MTAVTMGCVDEGSGGPAAFTPLALRHSATASYDIDALNITHM